MVHAHTGLPDGAAAGRLADELGVGLLVTEHSSTAAVELEDPDARALYAALLAGRRRVVAVGRGLADHIATATGADAGAIEVLPNAVPVEDFPSVGAAGRDPNELLYVGSRKASKGIETLLRAFAAVRAARPRVDAPAHRLAGSARRRGALARGHRRARAGRRRFG